MARIDTLYLEDPYRGSLRIVADLAREGISISRARVRILKRRIALWAINQSPLTTFWGDRSAVYVCLVDLSQITAVDQAWPTDITYIPL
jgi:hypothetical protein